MIPHHFESEVRQRRGGPRQLGGTTFSGKIRTAGVALVVALVFADSVVSEAQEYRVVDPTRRAIELPHDFTRVGGVFERIDRRVVVVDVGDGIVELADFSNGQVHPIGRQGAGPGEYRIPRFLYPLGGDSVAVLDDAASRLLVITAAGRPGGFLSPRSRLPAAAGVAAVTSDERGFLYGEAPATRLGPNGQFEPTDSAPILRWDLRDRVADTVAFVARTPPGGAVTSASGVLVAPGAVPVLLTRDRWVVGSDGRVAVVDHDPYAVTAILPSGLTHPGAPIPYQRRLVDDSVKRAFLAAREPTTGLVVSSDGSVTRIRRPPSRQFPTTWAREVPPFLPSAFMAFDSRGILWVQRTTFGRDGGRYDLIDSTGAVSERIRFPEGHRVVGFGRGTVYLIRRNADDLEFLQRMDLP